MYIASPPSAQVKINPKTVNINMMLPPKKKACCLPLRLDVLPFIKKEIVIGIIGKTQGVIRANNPAVNETKNTVQNDLSLVATSFSVLACSIVVFSCSTSLFSSYSL